MGHYRDRDSRYPSQVRNPFSKEPAIRQVPRGADTDPFGTKEATPGRQPTPADVAANKATQRAEIIQRRNAGRLGKDPHPEEWDV
ncbi:MAG TPA: hypothetical protein VLB73_03735 [Patescibacteria group bacterium]|nr:hypothetical protein [Patescibacteria group bacterium]